jgi:uncharacterized membrane protein (Fun14 family)
MGYVGTVARKATPHVGGAAILGVIDQLVLKGSVAIAELVIGVVKCGFSREQPGVIR